MPFKITLHTIIILSMHLLKYNDVFTFFMQFCKMYNSISGFKLLCNSFADITLNNALSNLFSFRNCCLASLKKCTMSNHTITNIFLS